MDYTEIALEIAKEITVAKMSNATTQVTKAGGESVAAFYEAIFKKVIELSKESKD